MSNQVFHLGEGIDSRTGMADKSISSEAVSFFNKSGKRIVGFSDRLTDQETKNALVIIVPGYGKTKISNLRLAYYLALNGFHVIRYDHSNHVGDSDGSMLFTTLGQMDEDLRSVIELAEKTSAGVNIGLVGESLGARVALKRASRDKRVRFFVSVLGVFDIQETLRTIYDEDGFIEKLNGS